MLNWRTVSGAILFGNGVKCFHLPIYHANRRTFAAVPSWEDFEATIEYDPSATPTNIDTLMVRDAPEWSKDCPTLFREREGWCPYSERVWLALELCDVSYDTVRVDNSGYGPRPNYFSGSTPQMRWPDGTMQRESMDIVHRIFSDYGGGDSNSNTEEHNYIISLWDTIMPRGCRPSSRAAFLFRGNGEPLWESQCMEALSGIEAMMSHSSEGPFLTGERVGPADVFWAPFLERYRYQLPCLYETMDPMDYPNLRTWYTVMDETIPPYSCRVKGNGAASWRKVLRMAGFGNAGVPPNIQGNMDAVIVKEEDESRRAMVFGPKLWAEYANSRPYLASSPSAQAALTIVQNHHRVCEDAFQRSSIWNNKDDLDIDMRSLVEILLADTNEISPNVRKLAAFLTDRMCVPRDMGCLPAASIHVLSLVEN